MQLLPPEMRRISQKLEAPTGGGKVATAAAGVSERKKFWVFGPGQGKDRRNGNGSLRQDVGHAANTLVTCALRAMIQHRAS